MIGLAIARRRVGATRRRLALGALVATLLAACGSGGDELAGDETGDSANVGLYLTEVWTRPTAPGAESTAFYVTIVNESASQDWVVGAESSSCETVELHLSSSTDGVMSMAPAGPDDLEVPPKESLIMGPGGLHIMCMGLTEPVVAGQEVDLAVRFEQAGTITTEAKVESR